MTEHHSTVQRAPAITLAAPPAYSVNKYAQCTQGCKVMWDVSCGWFYHGLWMRSTCKMFIFWIHMEEIPLASPQTF